MLSFEQLNWALSEVGYLTDDTLDHLFVCFTLKLGKDLRFGVGVRMEGVVFL